MDAKKLDAMKCGMFNNKSYYGMKSSVLKSGICKYFRREMFGKFEWCVVEMMVFGFKTKALVTNLVHRLEILLMEEIVCDDVGVIVNSVRLLEKINACVVEIGNAENLYKQIALVMQFCDGIKECKKGRICSYVNCWWISQKLEIDMSKIILDKVLQFKKEGDSDVVLKYGEMLISYIEEKDEKIFAIFNSLLALEEKEGRRYGRADAIYLFWEIIQKKFVGVNGNKQKVFEFALNIFNRKTMKERKMFGVWLGMIVIKTNENIDWDKEYVYVNSMLDVEEYLSSRKKIEVDEDFVVNDWHVNKKFGLKKFAEVGAFVVNEDISILGENGMRYKAFYIEKKIEKDEENMKVKEKVVKVVKVKEKVVKEKKEKVVKVKEKVVKEKKEKVVKEKKEKIVKVVKEKVVKEKKEKVVKVVKEKKEKVVKEKKEKVVKVKEKVVKVKEKVVKVKEKVVKVKIDFVNFEENFKVVKVFDKGVCGMKKPCMLVENKKKVGELLVLKLMTKTMNYGLDYMFVDSLKEEFGLKSLEMRRMESDVCFSLVDKSKKNFCGNWKLDIGDKKEVYCVMKYYENVGDLNRNKDMLKNEKVMEEMMKIRLFDGLFRSSDNIIRNILVLNDGALLSIDEGDIFGKRKNIFQKGDWCKKSKWCVENVGRIVDEFICGENKEKRLEIILKKMKEFGLNDEKIKECGERFNNYNKITIEN